MRKSSLLPTLKGYDSDTNNEPFSQPRFPTTVFSFKVAISIRKTSFAIKKLTGCFSCLDAFDICHFQKGIYRPGPEAFLLLLLMRTFRDEYANNEETSSCFSSKRQMYAVALQRIVSFWWTQVMQRRTDGPSRYSRDIKRGEEKKRTFFSKLAPEKVFFYSFHSFLLLLPSAKVLCSRHGERD